jgi:hypothetical protein
MTHARVGPTRERPSLDPGGIVKDRRIVLVVAGLLVLSAALYLGLWSVYPDRLADIGFYTLLDIAFIPLSVVFVGVVIDRVLAARERQALLHKMNMVVGAFFAEVGTGLLCLLTRFDTKPDDLRPHLLFTGGWTPRDYAAARAAVTSEGRPMDLRRSDAVELRDFLVEHRRFMLGLLENPNLLEHDTFTDALWAVFHLAEELSARSDLGTVPEADVRHIQVDMARAYGRLLGEWLGYVRHLKADYPYLFSFAVRTNPFDPQASIEVVER